MRMAKYFHALEENFKDLTAHYKAGEIDKDTYFLLIKQIDVDNSISEEGRKEDSRRAKLKEKLARALASEVVDE